MMNSRSRFFRVLRRTGSLLFLVSLAVLSVEHVCAQPGDRKTPQQIRKGLLAQLAEIEKQLSENPEANYLYEMRGKVLTDLFKKSEDRIERTSFAERAFADFGTFELLTNGKVPLPRAELHRLIWWSEFPNKPADSPLLSAEVEAFRNSRHFEAAVSAYLETIRLWEQAKSNILADEWLRDLWTTLSNLYLHSARVVAGTPVTGRTMSDLQLIWNDFDQAVEYRKQSIDALTVVDVTEVYIDKAQAAYALGEFEIALGAYKAADDYMDHNWERHCEYHGASNCEQWKKVYLKRTGELRSRAGLKRAK